ncbi:GNAT family N-acetyltransferase [Nocardia sp. CDC160]|uniref:GNAT family N-acetyltransferase n=1 Tax=Nocardia sp. CDC160 TaxID=3112166 RepID=UPI002DBABE03|nr:GNAT family N-acetyltransferase [Nocardia sp. CDC160]MEC3916183.1 GNAT family N-acetyltransferase [Nocardia sp. CDC160]
MRIDITDDPVAFRGRVAGFLNREPLRHTIMCTVVENLIGGLAPSEQPSYFASVHETEVVGVAMCTAGRGVWLGELPDEVVPELAGRFAEVLPDIPDVVGSASSAAAFAAEWDKLRGTTARNGPVVERLYRLGRLHNPPAPGAPRPATEADIELCRRWTAAMSREIREPTVELSESALRARIAKGRWWLWKIEDRPVSLTAHQVPAYGWTRIGPVYTPPEHRAHGYASALVAHVSRILLDTGTGVCLYADLANPTSNKVYRALGFEPVFDQVHYVFG